MGYPIGSGVTEAGCKKVVKQRLCQLECDGAWTTHKECSSHERWSIPINAGSNSGNLI